MRCESGCEKLSGFESEGQAMRQGVQAALGPENRPLLAASQETSVLQYKGLNSDNNLMKP